MADAVISIVVERIATIIQDQIRSEVNLVRGVEKELLRLSDKLRTITNVLDDAEKRGVKDQSVKSWLKKLENTAYEMDDILDEWNYSLLKHKIEASAEPEPEPKKMVCCSFISSSCLCFKKVSVRRDTALKIENVKVKLDQILKEKNDFEFVTSLPPTDPVPNSWRVQSTSFIEFEKVCGLDIEMNKDDIVEKVLSADTQILSIVGTGGIGKTTLAQLVYNDDQVESCFELRIWICVSNPFDLVAIAKGIIGSVKKEIIPLGINQLELVLEKLGDCISGKKFLLILDDVWTEKYDEWGPLKINLRKGAVGSKILVTTRKETTAKMMGTLDNDIYRPKQLTDEECWSLLRWISLSGRDGEELEEFESVGKKIATKCSGLPLAANVLGRLLQFKYDLQEWEDVEKSEIWQLENVEVDLFPHLVLSYNDLSPPLKRCFSYCAIYPKDHEIRADRLIEEWMALGYLGSVSGNGEVELKGRRYLNNLAMRSLFQDCVKIDEQIVRCKMHDIVHDFAVFLRKNDNKDEVAKMRKESCRVCDPLLVSQAKEYRRLFLDNRRQVGLCDCISSVRVFGLAWGFHDPLLQGMEKLIHVRRLELSGNVLKDEDLKNICKLYFLQILLLSRCSLRNIPGEIGDLVHLRNLDLSWNMFMDLPESICRLVELQTLNLKSCDELYKLPEGIHMLENLQHLFIDRAHASQGRLVQGVAQLSGIRTFGDLSYYGIENTFRVARDANKFELLKNLNLLTGTLRLEIFFDTIPDVEELARTAGEAELRKKIHVHSLRILFLSKCQWEYDSGQEENSRLSLELIEALQPHPKLSNLVIMGYAGYALPCWMSSPLNFVKHIHLHHHLHLSSLTPMGKLPLLEDLILESLNKMEFLGREFLGIVASSSNHVVVFPKLKELAFDSLICWEEWEDITVEEEESAAISIMPCLIHLTIYSCESLKKLPHRFLHKVSSSLLLLDISGSTKLLKTYGEDNEGSPRRSIFQHNPQLELRHQYDGPSMSFRW